jgi:hypothetical protein
MALHLSSVVVQCYVLHPAVLSDVETNPDGGIDAYLYA